VWCGDGGRGSHYGAIERVEAQAEEPETVTGHAAILRTSPGHPRPLHAARTSADPCVVGGSGGRHTSLVHISNHHAAIDDVLPASS
jgi:hypothetical protein